MRTFGGGPVLQPTSHPALTCLCGCSETFACFFPLPPLFFMSLCFPILAGSAKIHARKVVFMASCNWLAQPCEILTSIQELVLLSDQPEEITHGVKCLPSPLLPWGLTAAPTSLLVRFPVLPVFRCSPASPHLLGMSSAGAFWDSDGGEMHG